MKKILFITSLILITFSACEKPTKTDSEEVKAGEESIAEETAAETESASEETQDEDKVDEGSKDKLENDTDNKKSKKENS